jgi:hypothetical protein
MSSSEFSPDEKKERRFLSTRARGIVMVDELATALRSEPGEKAMARLAEPHHVM